MKKNKGLMKILTIISILLVSLVVFSGCGKEKKEKEDKSYLDPINSMMTALQNKDIDEYLKTVPAEYQEKMEENYAYPDCRRRGRNCPGTEGFAGKKQVLQDSLRENIQTVILKYIKIGYL